jgi:hypothetical protein
MAAIMPMMMPVMVMLSYFYNHLRRSWNNRSRKQKKCHSSHQQRCELSFQGKQLSCQLDGSYAIAKHGYIVHAVSPRDLAR